MLSIGLAATRWIAAGAMVGCLAAPAWGEGADGDASVGLVVASLTPMPPIEVVPPVPDARQYVFHYEVQYSPARLAGETFGPADYYAVPVPDAAHYQAASTPLHIGYSQPFVPQTNGAAARDPFSVAPAATLIDTLSLTDDDSLSPSHPQRRLSVLVDDWRVSASAHLSHNVGATVTMRRKF